MNIFRLINYVLVFALVLTGLVTDYWISTSSLERNGKVLSSSFIHGGLFYGERQLDWGLGPSHQYFSVYDEITQKIGFMNKILWILVIFFIALGLFWSFIGLMISLLNTVAKERKTILGPSGIYLWSLLSICSYSAAIFIYLLQYYSTIQKNVLLPDQLTAGFSSTNRTQLAFSFYLIVAAIGSLFIPMSLLCFSNSIQQRPKTKTIPIDTTVFMY
uniref:Uncharacterized protein n=1 Tax=Panagrolaimus sp. PS1159 TaxID=55785 RepID=A0AC35GDR6_9BILA